MGNGVLDHEKPDCALLDTVIQLPPSGVADVLAPKETTFQFVPHHRLEGQNVLRLGRQDARVAEDALEVGEIMFRQ